MGASTRRNAETANSHSLGLGNRRATGNFEKRLTNMKYTFRPHRGGYEEAAQQRFTFETFPEFMTKLETVIGYRPDEIRSHFYAEDDRMTPSESYVVMALWPGSDHMAPIGFSSAPINLTRGTHSPTNEHESHTRTTAGH
jgi:hypothetical protein